MEAVTAKLWALQDRQVGDRRRLFSAVCHAVDVQSALYPGCFVDVAASFFVPEVTYVDIDRRAPKFFADAPGVREIIADNLGPDIGDRAEERPARSFSFIGADYREDLGLADESFDLLISLYAGFVSEHCTRYLRVGGSLLVNSSHGDAAMASIDPRYRLSAVVASTDGEYRVRTTALDTYLIPKRDQEVTVELLHELGRGIGYTKSPFAYLFERIR